MAEFEEHKRKMAEEATSLREKVETEKKHYEEYPSSALFSLYNRPLLNTRPYLYMRSEWIRCLKMREKRRKQFWKNLSVSLIVVYLSGCSFLK